VIGMGGDEDHDDLPLGESFVESVLRISSGEW
jgi:hypothetical protein